MLVTVDRKSSWQNVLTMNVSISYGGVTDPLVNRMALGLVVKLEKVSVFCVKTSTMLHHSCAGSPWYTSPRI